MHGRRRVGSAVRVVAAGAASEQSVCCVCAPPPNRPACLPLAMPLPTGPLALEMQQHKVVTGALEVEFLEHAIQGAHHLPPVPNSCRPVGAAAVLMTRSVQSAYLLMMLGGHAMR